MNLKHYLILICVLIVFQINLSETRIILKVDNEVITNIDLENESKYLKIQSTDVNKLSLSELKSLSKNSLIKQMIKKREIDKYFSYEKNNNLGDKLIKQYYVSKGFKKKNDFVNFLNDEKIEYEVFKEKLITTKLWNTLIFEKFKNKIVINENEIREKIRISIANKKKVYEYDLSEILFDSEINYISLVSFINKYGFETAASKYSISDTSINGGKIGWVQISNLTNQLKKLISKLNKGEISKPVKISNGNLLLKINDKREIKNKLNLDEEVKKQINFEKNRQLNNFSLNFYKKLKQNSNINEY